MILVSAFMLCFASAKAASAELLNGAGATFPAPLYSKWSYEYAKQTKMKLNYQSIGSGGGIKQIMAGPTLRLARRSLKKPTSSSSPWP